MNGIQVVLLAGIGLITLAFIKKTRGKGFNIVLLASAAIVSVIFILWPEVTSKIAKILGVGRGADFVFYISILVFWYIFIQLFARIRKLEQTMTEIIRRDAIQSASRLPVNDPGDAA
jgi:small membrane protein